MPKLINKVPKVIARNPNFNRIGSAINYIPDNNPNLHIKTLQDKKNNRKLVLVGTLNCSNILAQKTKKLLNTLNPDSILLQTDPDWYK